MGELVAIARHQARRGPVEELARATISVERGVAGDVRGAAPGRQVTVMSAERWAEACAALGADAPWTLRRANLLVSGVALDDTPGRILAIGPVALEVTQECHPCARMDAQRDGLRAALTPDLRAGLCCRVVTGGDIQVGDPVAWKS